MTSTIMLVSIGLLLVAKLIELRDGDYDNAFYYGAAAIAFLGLMTL